jgi:glycosyltransferase involved in cell wall biosynthesis
MIFFPIGSNRKKGKFNKIVFDTNPQPINYDKPIVNNESIFSQEYYLISRPTYLVEDPNRIINIPKNIDYNKTLITFIIPTIGRDSLKKAVESIQMQTCKNWLAIIIFDGIEPNIECDDPRILFLTCDKLGKNKNYAGHVRNYGMSFVKTEWIAFLDDDDSISSNYVKIFYDEILSNSMDVIIFRMYFNNEILPSLDDLDFYKGKVGISFAIKKKIFDSGLLFSPSDYEDYEYLSLIKQNDYSIMISPYVLYFVKEYNLTCDISGIRTILNQKTKPLDHLIQTVEPIPLNNEIRDEVLDCINDSIIDLSNHNIYYYYCKKYKRIKIEKILCV